jgi:DNA repair protein RadC
MKGYRSAMSRRSRRTEIPEQDQPREKLLAKGAAALTDQALMAVVLGKGSPRMDVMTLAGKLVRVIGEQRLGVRAKDLRGFEGVGRIC